MVETGQPATSETIGDSDMSSTTYAIDQAADAEADPACDVERRPMPVARAALRRLGTHVLIASSQPIVRHGLRVLLADEPDLDLIAEAEDGRSAIRLARQLRPDVVVIDLLLPEVDGIEATRIIRSDAPGTHVVIIAGVDDDAPAIASIRAGASAYLPTETRTDVLLQAIRNASTGQVAMSVRAASRLIGNIGRHERISGREADVMRLVAQGKTNKQIARELDIAPSTVKSHVGSLFGKLDVSSRTELALYATRTGLTVLKDGSAAPTNGQLFGM
jgi:DNA-binding NarL/FixJ family response regulator